MIGRDSMIPKVDGVMNAVSVIGDAVGETNVLWSWSWW